ncbi:unnamed protein product [Arctia plantaginis]|uniref:HTH psq-type domain-containing protein n=1 Tax=Arctia plantaginis TaxID=874455 RepID=A0A8S1BER7_ARCPL|nr:unnamed protein product [Arctia plantaginis]
MQSQLASLLKTAEELRIKGLTDIRWNNKDEPPDCEAGIVATATPSDPKPLEKQQIEAKQPKHPSPKHSPELPEQKPKDDEHKISERFNVNGGPPPLIKLPIKEKHSPVKREHSDTDSPSPKRQRQTSRSELTDDDLTVPKLEREQDWQHGNLDITAERVVGWGMSGASTSRDASDDEWGDAPTDIGSFLHTKLRVDGDNSADEESNESVPLAPPSSSSSSLSTAAAGTASELRVELAKAQLTLAQRPVTIGPKSGPTDPRFTDVVKLTDYLQHGRRPQFWEENYVKRVMEAVRLKELEMKQAAEILGVSYGTLYGRYRDVYGCINRPYSSCGVRAVREFWQAKGPSEVLERLQRGEVSLHAAAQALGVSIANLAAHVADFGVPDKDFDQPIPIEMDPSLKIRSSSTVAKPPRKPPPPAATAPLDKAMKKILIGSVTDEEPIPATLITTYDPKQPPVSTPAAASGKWPSIRVASLDTLRGNEPPTTAVPTPASPSALMRTRPDLTIVAAKKSTAEDEEQS